VAVPLDTVESRLALGKSEMGALFFNTLEVNDSASYWFTRLLNDHPGSVHVPRALYTLAQIARQDSQQGVADSLYQVLADRYGKTEFGGTARKFLGYSDSTDSTDGSEDLYRSGEQALEGGDPSGAVKHFGDVVRLFPKSPFAAKAEYATGWIYEQILVAPESALAHYRLVADHFSTTPYALTVRPKLEAVDQFHREKAAQEQAARDSLSRLEAARKVDSTAAKSASPSAPGDTTGVLPTEEKSDTTGREITPPPPESPPDTTGNQNLVLPPEVQPDTTGNQNQFLPPEIQPDSSGNQSMEPPPEVQPDTTGNGGGDPPPPPESHASQSQESFLP
jgi:hypothetical protein